MPYLKYHFSGQKEDEKVVLVVHRHWFNIFQHFVSISLLIFLLIASHVILPVLFNSLNIEIFNRLITFLENLFAMLIWLIFFIIWVDYYFDVWIITNKRVVNVEQKALFSRDVSELHFDKIQDVSTRVEGLIPTFLNYGDVQIQTAGTEENFVFRKVSNPYQIKDLIMSLQKRGAQTDMEELKNIIQAE